MQNHEGYVVESVAEVVESVLNACGYQTSDGQWHGLEEKNVDLDEYKIIQYYEIFKKNK